jgi:hypothetical protein
VRSTSDNPCSGEKRAGRRLSFAKVTKMLAAGSKDRSQAIDMLRIVLIFVVVVMVGSADWRGIAEAAFGFVGDLASGPMSTAALAWAHCSRPLIGLHRCRPQSSSMRPATASCPPAGHAAWGPAAGQAAPCDAVSHRQPRPCRRGAARVGLPSPNAGCQPRGGIRGFRERGVGRCWQGVGRGVGRLIPLPS